MLDDGLLGLDPGTDGGGFSLNAELPKTTTSERALLASLRFSSTGVFYTSTGTGGNIPLAQDIILAGMGMPGQAMSD